MPLAGELELPLLDHTDPTLRGRRYHEAMAGVAAHDGWLCASPFGFVVVDREAGEFFLRTRQAVFPGLKIAELFEIADGPLHEEIVRNIININGEDHRRLRNLVNPALSPRAAASLRPRMRGFAEELLEPILERGECEFIADFARPYPSLVIAALMGAPLADAPRLQHWSNLIQRQFDAASLIAERALIEQAVDEFYAYEDALIARRRQDPGEDLISSLIAAEEPDDSRAARSGEAGCRAGGGREGTRLTADELRNLVLNILVGGVDTSQSQLAHAVRMLALHPDDWQALRTDPHGLAPAAVEEALRYEPITPFTARITTAELEYRGVSFPAGSIVLVSAWHANRQNSEPQRFDITAPRGEHRTLTFGAGIHYCLGANLARAEMQEALALLAERVETLEPAGEPEFGTPSGIYGLEALPLRLSAA